MDGKEFHKKIKSQKNNSIIIFDEVPNNYKIELEDTQKKYAKIFKLTRKYKKSEISLE